MLSEKNRILWDWVKFLVIFKGNPNFLKLIISLHIPRGKKKFKRTKGQY